MLSLFNGLSRQAEHSAAISLPMLRFALLVCVAVETVRANLTGVTVAAGDCLCVSGTNVNARDKPGTSGTHVVATYSTGTCFKLYGGILTVGDFRWYEVTDGSARFWIAGNYLTKSDASACTAGACSARQKELACEVFHSANIQAAQRHPSGVSDNGFAYNNLRDMCNGLKATRSHYTCSECPTGTPGGTTCLSTKLLEYLVALKNRFSDVVINELAGACHTCESRHYSGLAVDLDNPASRRQPYLDMCTSMGGWGQDEGNHIHCQFYDAPHPNW